MDISLLKSGDLDSLNVVIDISANSDPVKYEIDHVSGILKVDRFLPVSMVYPCNYGFIPGCMGGDGDFLDALVITRYPLLPGSLIVTRVVGILVMEDEGGLDEKILTVPIDKVDAFYKNIKDICDVPEMLLIQIQHFFSHYKDLESDKVVKVLGWRDRVYAMKVLKIS